MTDMFFLDIVPIVMAGIIAIYGLVVSVLIADGLKQSLPLYTGFIQLGAGLAVGLSGLAAGYASFDPQVSNLYTTYSLAYSLRGSGTDIFRLLVSLSVLLVMLVSVVLPSNQGSTSE
jgi:hypothetical protein